MPELIALFAYPMCMVCAHRGDDLTCTAFPGGIPEEIIEGADHRHPFPGDQGIRFEAAGDLPVDLVAAVLERYDQNHTSSQEPGQ